MPAASAPYMTLDGFHPEFADFAERMAADRIRTYPDRVKAGEFSQAEADRRIFVMRAIAAIWRCNVDNDIPEKRWCKLTKTEAVETLAKAIELAEKRLQRQPDNRQHKLHHDQLQAMYWWHNHFGARAYVQNMALDLRWQARQRAEQRQAEQQPAGGRMCGDGRDHGNQVPA
jgi:hypothetical protein